MMGVIWHAQLNPASPRYEDWKKILGTDGVGLITPVAFTATLGKEKETVHLLDWQNLEADPSDRLLAFLSEKFHVGAEEIALQLDEDGHFPIRAYDVIITYEKWFI